MTDTWTPAEMEPALLALEDITPKTMATACEMVRHAHDAGMPRPQMSRDKNGAVRCAWRAPKGWMTAKESLVRMRFGIGDGGMSCETPVARVAPLLRAFVTVTKEGAALASAPFDATAAVLSYVAARGTAHEDDILAALEAAEEAHHERAGVDSYDNVHGPALLGGLVTAGRLRWRDKPGHRGDLSEPLLYSLSKREQRARGGKTVVPIDDTPEAREDALRFPGSAG